MSEDRKMRHYNRRIRNKGVCPNCGGPKMGEPKAKPGSLCAACSNEKKGRRLAREAQERKYRALGI